MGFTTNTFLFIFLPLSILVYLIGKKLFSCKTQNYILIIINYLFYACVSLETLVLMIGLTGIVYLFGLLANNRDENVPKNLSSWFCVLSVGYLLCSKYLPFIYFQILDSKDINPILAPVGISFFIFESISYVIDIKRNEAKPGTFLECSLFLSLFPKLISGPIVQWKDFINYTNNRQTSSEDISNGINRIIIGLAKKSIIADTLGAKILEIDSSTEIDTPTLWLRAVLFFFQIYYDFAGYSDIALGLSRIFGFKFKENFNYPYMSSSISEFWRRWHISLGTWFKEYVYIPLGGNRTGNVYFNLFVVFLLTGIWHGANWTFLVWGIYNGIFILAERYLKTKKYYILVPQLIKWTFTICIIFFGWIIFNSTDIEQCKDTICRLFSYQTEGNICFTYEYYLTNKIIIILVISALGAISGFNNIINIVENFAKHTTIGMIICKIIYIILLVINILYIVNSSYSPFIYFQF